jgi:hypothetical protein
MRYVAADRGTNLDGRRRAQGEKRRALHPQPQLLQLSAGKGRQIPVWPQL